MYPDCLVLSSQQNICCGYSLRHFQCVPSTHNICFYVEIVFYCHFLIFNYRAVFKEREKNIVLIIITYLAHYLN